MKIAIVGTGYVGLVSGACLADLGHTVVCIDRDERRIETLEHGRVPFFEPGLAELVAGGRSSGRLRFSLNIAEAGGCEAVFIGVGTPPDPVTGHADLTAVLAVTREIARVISNFTVVVCKSTVPVGTGDRIEEILAAAIAPSGFAAVSNPEFLREGNAIQDFMKPDRVVVGTADARAISVMEDIYRPLTARGTPLVVTSRRSSELSKYAGNAFLAMKVAFINEIADLCESAGGDIEDVARIIGLDSRIGEKFLRAGPGFGGSCFPKDTLSLIRTARELETPLHLIETTIGSNAARTQTMLKKIATACGGSVKGKTIGVWGLTFKPDTDDMRESPALPIISGLADAGAVVQAYDPEGMANAKAAGSPARLCAAQYDAATGADALVLITEWKNFRNPDFARLAEIMRGRAIVDLRNAVSGDAARRHGFSYTGVGRGGTGS